MTTIQTTTTDHAACGDGPVPAHPISGRLSAATAICPLAAGCLCRLMAT